MGGTSRNRQSGQVTLSHLLLVIAFVMPVSEALAELKHSGSDWKLGKALWSRSKLHSPKVRNAIAIFKFTLQLLWFAVGAVSGFALAALAACIFQMKNAPNNAPPVMKWGLIDLLAGCTGMAPLLATIAALRHSGGSFLAYVLVVPSALAIGSQCSGPKESSYRRSIVERKTGSRTLRMELVFRS